MRIAARELNRATLARQLLLDREALSVADAVRRVVGLQAQLPASPYVALWNRLAGFDPAELDDAFAGQRVVRATAFHPLPGSVWAGLAAEAQALVPFLAGREPEVYRRYHHWWAKLPHGQTRLLPGP